MPGGQLSSPGIAVEGNGASVALGGNLDVYTLAEAESELRDRLKQPGPRTLDIGGLAGLDTAGALFLCGLRDRGVELAGARAEHQGLLDLVCGLDIEPLPKPRPTPRWRDLVVQLGKSMDEASRNCYDVIAFVGRVFGAAGHALIYSRSLSLPSVSRHIAETGINALPIVGLMAIMISVVIGYQGFAQLRPFGGEDFTVNLVAVSVLREMGVLITAIMVAGRTGSAFAAEIGVMRSREEVDALEVMGLEPMSLLVMPRVLALVVTLPLLAFYADVMGLLGGGAIAQINLHLSPPQYLDRVHQAVTYQDLLVGLIKAPVFAFVIGITGCMHGLRARGSAESVGRETTGSVVTAIFLVIVLDALFSVLFEKLGI